MDGLWTEAHGQQKQSNDPGTTSGTNGTPCHIQHSPNTPTTGLRERGNDTSKSTGRSGQQKVATGRNMRREERVTVQGPVKEQQPDGMSHRGFGIGEIWNDEIWHNNIVPKFAMVFKNQSHLFRCRGGYKAPRRLSCPTSGSVDDHHHGQESKKP